MELSAFSTSAYRVCAMAEQQSCLRGADLSGSFAAVVCTLLPAFSNLQPLSPTLLCIHARPRVRVVATLPVSAGQPALKHMALFTDEHPLCLTSNKKRGETRCSAEGGIMGSGMYFVRGLQV